jgi:hypothetical protein
MPVAILPVQQADADGNARTGDREAARASRAILAEEVVSARRFERSQPHADPGFLVSAVFISPGMLTTPCEGYYGREHGFFHAYLEPHAEGFPVARRMGPLRRGPRGVFEATGSAG